MRWLSVPANVNEDYENMKMLQIYFEWKKINGTTEKWNAEKSEYGIPFTNNAQIALNKIHLY